MSLFNLLIQIYHACGPKCIRQKFVVHISKLIIGIVTTSPEAMSSRAKLDVACFCWVSLVVKGMNILRMRKLRRAKSSASEVKNECVERFVCEWFYLLLLFFIYSLVFISSSCFCCCS